MFGFIRGKRDRLRREASDWLTRMQSGASEADRVAFRRWYEADAAHAETFERVRARYGGTGIIAGTEFARRNTLAQAEPQFTRSGAYAMVAGVAALLAISGAVLLGRPESLMPRAEAQPLFFATRVGEIRQVPLPDGTRLTLDTRTALTVQMARGLRLVRLREGRVRFAVARDERPFVVEAGRTRVTGNETTFDVALSAGEAAVRPVTGSVTVQNGNAGAETAPVRLAPGEAVLVSATGERRQPRQSSGSEPLWPTGMLEFDDTELDIVVREANRYSQSQLSLAEPSLSRLRASGTFRAGDLEGLARSLEAAFGLRLERPAPDRLVLYPPAKKAVSPK